MSFDASGIFHRIRDWTNDAAAAIKIRADYHDDHDEDLAGGLSECITRTGKSQITADIPFNNKKITGLYGPPTGANDAANKAYVDSVKSFSTAVTISGSALEGRIKFTGAVGPWGLQFPDLFFGVRAAADPAGTVNRFHWNDKADATGRELMSLTEASVLTLFGVTDAVSPGLVLNTKRPDTTGATITFQQHSPSPAAADYIGQIDFYGKTTTATDQIYARIYGGITDPTVSSEDGEIHLQTRKAGTFTDTVKIDKNGMAVSGGMNWTANTDTTTPIHTSSLSGSSFSLINRDPGAASAPLMILQRASASPAANDIMGQIYFQGMSSAAAVRNYAAIYSTIMDPTNAAEDGALTLQTATAGLIKDRLKIDQNGTYFYDPTGVAIRFSISAAGGVVINAAGSSPSINIVGSPSNNHGIFVGTSVVGNAAIIGYATGATLYGAIGFNVSGQTWGFYTNGSGYAVSSWSTSDEEAKADITSTDTAVALQQVLAIPVRSYTKKMVVESGLPNGEVGWLAQEIEPVIPQAVADIGIPNDDKYTRDMVGRDTIKATNDRTMLATLWAAVQELSAKVDALGAGA